MDSIDLLIIDCLTENARMRTSEIAKKADMSVSAIAERIKKLEENGTIMQYTAVLDRSKMGKSFQAMIGISTEHPKYMNTLSKQIMEDPNIVECLTLTGDLDFLLKVSAASPEHFQQIHLRIAGLEGVKSIKSYFVLQTTGRRSGVAVCAE